MENVISEDERYRTSTQFRLWSYTPAALHSLRSTTNKIAADRVRVAVGKAREARNGTTGDAEALPEGEVDCLTVEEELKLVAFYCRQTMQLGDHMSFPTELKATAIQYIKRFYITNSLMTYHATDILKTALYFSTKTECHYQSISKFADAIGKTKPDDVLASEFLLTQGLRFTFDIRHPFRALEGAMMDIEAIAKHNIPIIPGGDTTRNYPDNLSRRLRYAHDKAKDYLKFSAAFTDVYFHYTPSQIMIASLLLSDKELAEWYLKSKIPESLGDLQAKILGAVRKCAEMLKAVEPNAESSAAERKECQALAKKLKKCRNPEKIDLIGLQRAKREGDSLDDEKVAKKRKLEREKSAAEVDELFGPAIKRK